MKSIWKFPIEAVLTDTFEIDMPIGAEILTVQMQRDVPCFWAIVDPSVNRMTRRFRMVGTGHKFDFGADRYDTAPLYIGTIQMADGALVWHFFEIIA